MWGGGSDVPLERAMLGVLSQTETHWTEYSVRSQRRSSVGLQTCQQGTARHGESEAAEWTRRQVWGRYGLSSELFDHLLMLSFILSKCHDDDDDDVAFISGVSAT